ncbi:hypothetical protein PILCRDRAFT_1822 [Piloderma croceum F 1598]|uniref:HNH nuclease domain-containing protein n=1 Tax=Piloderma croceum (strain F 1598) TaxID=765440 RepID=A0A0C3CLJ9_PILCF|nr:hypothetical protein PILCRDRAFT_1822 [Piloderma croceum F 1598]
MVNVYLNVEDRQVLALSIPFSDIERLSVRPVKWLRFVTFTIFVVRGNLSATPNGPPVDYDSISLAGPIAEAYYYIPEGNYHIIDYNALNDRITSSERTIRSSRFRSNIETRDGLVCIFTGARGSRCDAARLLPKTKGDEYIGVVLEDRFSLYDPALESGILGINSVENGMLMRKDLHALFGRGESAFIKTPNFALDTADIPRVELDPMPPSRITLHHFQSDDSDPIRQSDARMAGTGISPPSTAVLDFMYGVAAYRRWGTSLPPSDGDSSPESDDDNDDDKPNIQLRGRNDTSNMSDGMLRAMDNVLTLSMLLKGTTPELIAAERQRREEAEELHAKEASRVKVQEWMQSSPDIAFLSNASQNTTETAVDVEQRLANDK